jgi:uncharacterized protein (DUF1015 family)
VLAPFRGLRYAAGRVSGLAAVTSPPYDVIGGDTEAHLLAADPHNVVRLILPRPGPGQPAGGYREAARTFRQWQEEGILVPDPEPALYVYEQSQDGQVLQRGLIGALRLAPLGAGPVLPHEEVMAGPVTGRRQLMEATQANLEPIFLLYGGEPGSPGPGHRAGRRDEPAAGSAATRLADEVAERRPPLLSVDTDDGLRHRLWAVTDPAEQARAAADLAGRQALIADGHHRYAAYLDLQARKRAGRAGPGPWDAGLALLVDAAAYPPTIGAIHRVVTGLPVSEAARLAKSAFMVQPVAVPPGSPAGAALRLVRQAAGGGTAFLIAGGGEWHLLTDPDPAAVAAAMPGRSPAWRRLPAAVLQELLLARLWGVRDSSSRVQVYHDAAGALRAAATPPGGTAVICPALSAADVREVAAAGERVPRKSTSFLPKPRSGLVLRAFALG